MSIESDGNFMYNLLKENVFRLISEKGLSVRQVERDLGFGYGTLQAWDKHMPSIDKVEKVAKYFDVSIDALVGYEGERNTDMKHLMDTVTWLSKEDIAALIVVAEQLKGK